MHTLCETAQAVSDDLIDSHRAMARHTARFLIQLREFDLRRAYRQPRKGGSTSRSTAEWLHETCGVAEPVTRQHLRVAYSLLNLPAIEEAFERGDLSYRKVCAASQYTTALNEAAVLDLLLTMTDQQAEQHFELPKEEAGAAGASPTHSAEAAPAILAPRTPSQAFP